MSRRTEKNVGIIGLGIIGQRVAENVRRRGFHVFVWNRTPRPFPNFVGSPEEVAELCDYIQVFVADDEALLEVVQQMKPSLNAHHVIMAHSTVAPHTVRAAAEVAQRRGAQLLDAPFTGSKEAAGKGELVYYIGGDEAAYRRVRPVLQASSKEILEIGEIGQAMTIKIATNMVTAATVQATAEALALVHSAGLGLDKFAQAMNGNGSNSGTLTMKLPKMLQGDFEPQFSVKHMLKDVQIALRLARSWGLSLTATEAARDSLLEQARLDRGDDDYSGVVRNFFPDGPPQKSAAGAEESEEQTTLAGLDHPPEVQIEAETMEVPPPAKEEVPAAVAETAEAIPTTEEPVREAWPTEVEAENSPPLPEQEIPSLEEPAMGREVSDERPTPIETESPVPAKPSDSPPAEGEEGAPRGFLSRLFGKGADY